MSRMTTAMFHPDQFRMQVFVDDPILAARGTRAHRRRSLCIALLFWLAMGMTLSWAKRQLGFKVIWIGVQIELSKEEVTLCIQIRMVEKHLAECHELLGMKALPLRRLRSFVGGLTWMMTIITWLRAWLAPLWSAVASAALWGGPPEKATVGRRQVIHSLTWIAAFLGKQKGSITRVLPIRERHLQHLVQIVCDASPYGMGAVLLEDGVPKQRLDDVFTDQDHKMLGTTAGSHEGQALFEALAVLVAIRAWMPLWRDHPTAVVIQSDSLAALGAAAKIGSSIPAMNTVMRELSLDLAEGLYEVSLFGHVPGSLNTWADALSRLRAPTEAKTVPEELLEVPTAALEVRTKDWWRASGLPTL